MATAPRQTLHLVVGAALLSAVLVCWVGGLGSATPSELLEPSVRERVANLESQAKEIESVRQDAKYLDRQIAELEKEGETGKMHESELQTKAAELRHRLLGLAHQAKISPSRLLTRHEQHLAVSKVPAERAMPAHRAIDDPYFKGTYYSTKRTGPSPKEIGALAEVEGTKQDQAHFEHRFGGLGQQGVEAWEVAPKQNEFGEEEHASMTYLNRHHKPSWLYAPHEGSFGSDAPPGAKPSKPKYLHRYGGHGSDTPAWAYNPKIGTPSWKISPKQDKAETPAQREASSWFKGLRTSKTSTAGSKAVEIATTGDVGKHFGKDFSDFKSQLSAKMAKELDTLQAADKAVAAMQRHQAQDIHPDHDQESGSSESTPLARSASYLSRLVAADDEFGKQVQDMKAHTLNGQAKLVDEALREAAREASSSRSSRSSRPAPHLARRSHHPSALHTSAQSGESERRNARAAWATVQGMQKDLEQVEAREAGMTGSERAQVGPDVSEMKEALEGAQVTAASEQRNEERLSATRRAAERAREEEAVLEGRKAAELRPLTKQALRAEDQVRQIKAALALARHKAAQAKERQAMSKLDRLGINTGEVHTQWGGDQVV
mmetsp:Transcript_48222/g.113824  ORF Transcript_48222/g.113824 Transcript_48222/m.113824 type:complete len:604 (-) Transcript_48222:61-1872(-)